MQRIILWGVGFFVALGAALGAYIFISLIPFFHQIGLAAAALVVIFLTCAAALVVTFCYTRIRMMLSHMRQSQLLSRVVAVGEVVAVPNGDGTWTHLSAMHEAAKVVPHMLPAPNVESVDPGLNEGEVIRTYQLGLSIKDTAKQHQGTEYEVRKILHK